MEETNEIENTNEGKHVTIKKSDIWKYSTFLLLAIVIVFGIIYFAKSGGVTGGATITGGTTNQPTQQPSQVRASIDDDAILGNKDASVTIIEFSDYQCPYCRKFWGETFSQIKEQYINTEKASLVFRDLPLSSIHPMAQQSAEAAECVREKGGDVAYFKYHDKVFSEQNIIDSGTPNGPVTKTATYTATDLKKWAKETGYNIDSCLDSGKFRSEVQKDSSDAQTAGGSGTPYFVILKKGESSGTAISGACSYDAFSKALDAEIAGKGWYQVPNTCNIVVA